MCSQNALAGRPSADEILGEVAVRPEPVERGKDMLDRVVIGQRREDRFDFVGAVEHRRDGGVDRIRDPRLPAFREQKQSGVRTDDGLHGRLKAWTQRRARLHASRPAQQQDGGNGLMSSRKSSSTPLGRGRIFTIRNFLPFRCA